jgi:hypothetical protein
VEGEQIEERGNIEKGDEEEKKEKKPKEKCKENEN